MPLYEYYCPDCRTTFEKLRQSTQADVITDCPDCKSTTPQRILSLFASSVKSGGNSLTGINESMRSAMPMGGGCCGGSCGCQH